MTIKQLVWVVCEVCERPTWDAFETPLQARRAAEALGWHIRRIPDSRRQLQERCPENPFDTDPARQSALEASPSARESAGGPSDHPNAPRGECLLPGSGAAAATAATESGATVGVASQADSADPRPRRAQSEPDGNDVRPGVGFELPPSKRFAIQK